MDLQSIVHVFGTVLSNNPEERKAGEQLLKQAENSPGHLVILLQVIVAQQLELPIRQAASIHFKQLLHKGWEPKEARFDNVGRAPEVGDLKFNNEDKQMVRDNLLEAIIHSPPLIRSQLGECLKAVIYNDYPTNWPTLLPLITQKLQSQEHQHMYGALYALRILSNKYEFKDAEDREPMQDVVNTTFPALLQIFQGLIQMQSSAVELADLMKLICKTFWSSTYLDIPTLLMNREVFVAWMTCFDALLRLPVPEEGQPTDLEQRKSWPWWKLKKWTLHVINRMFSRFGDPKLSRSMGDHIQGSKVFREIFKTEWSVRFLHAYVELLNGLRAGRYLPERVVNLALNYIMTAVPNKLTYKVMEPQLDMITLEIVFPVLCFNESDAELWRDDPHEYVRKGYDIIEDMYSPRTAAMNFIVELGNCKKERLERFIHFLIDVFTKYNQMAPEVRPYPQKDGALLAIGSLADKLKCTDPYKSALESMLVAHVLPEFQSPLGHIRAKAAWVAGQYADITFTNPQHFAALLQCIVQGLRDKELPVRVDSVVALRNFVDASQDLNEIRQILPQLLNELFLLMNEVENEDLVFTLQTIVEKFGEEIAPFALGLCQNLTQAFWKCLGDDDDEDDDDAGALAAVGCLRAISTIMESVSTLPHMYPQMEVMCLPIMVKMLSADDQDVYEEVLEMVSYLTYYSPSISPQMWTLFPILCKALQEWAIDYFENILIPLDNYISRGTQVFLQSQEPNYLLMTLEVLKLALHGDKVLETDAMPAPKLIGTVLQHCRGQVDEYLEQYVMLAVLRLQTTEKEYFKCLLMTVVANALFYNAAATIQILHKHGVLQSAFSQWFQLLYKTPKKGAQQAEAAAAAAAAGEKLKRKNFSKPGDKKICALGLLALLALPAEAMPLELQAGMGQVLMGALTFLEDLKVAEEEAANGDDDEDDEDDEDDLEEDDEDDDEDLDDEAQAQRMQDRVSSIRGKNFRFEEESDDEDWFDDDEDVETVLDPINPYIVCSDTLQSISVNDPNKFKAMTEAMNPAQQQVWQHVMQLADQERAKLAAANSAS